METIKETDAVKGNFRASDEVRKQRQALIEALASLGPIEQPEPEPWPDCEDCKRPMDRRAFQTNGHFHQYVCTHCGKEMEPIRVA